uniref:5'-3' exonuclease H3TH domain-containing protein n=1 Tax=Ruminococcus sp. TaxID=41978 RepID=UPI003AB2AAC6
MKLLAIDGNSIMNRAFYGIKLLSNSKGQFTNALTGFMNIYLKEIGEVKPDCVAVAFDLKAPTFRHKANAAYKANRKGMPEELAQQMPVIKELLGDLGIKIVQCEGYEADDILGTLSKAAADSDNECYILTGDRDSFQLVSDRVTVRLATTKETKIYTPERIMEEYGVTTRQMIEVKALMGDTSDNISGVKGIGEKTALSLIKQEGDVKTLYEHLADIKLTPSVRAKLENGHQDAIDSRFLAEICLEAPVEKATEFYKLGEVDTEKTKALLADLEMMRLIDRLGLSGKAVESADSAVQESKLKLSDLPKFEVKPLDESVISVLGKDKTTYFIFADNKLSILCNDVIYTTEDNAIIIAFMGTACEKITFEGKTAHKFAFSNGTHLENLTFCCDLAGYLLNSQSSEYTAENLCLSYKCLYRSDMGEYADLSSLPALSGNLKKQLEM